MFYDLQRASMWKRISAFLFDGILLTIVAVLMAWLLSVALNYDSYHATLNSAYERCGEEYGVSFNMTLAEYEDMTAEESASLEAAYAALSADEEALYAYNMVIQLTILITSIGILLGFVMMEFTVPMLLGNGQTLGKKIFGLGVMHEDGIRLTSVQLFIRSILGKYAIETMIPVLIIVMIFFGTIGLVGPAILAVLAIAEAALIITTRTNAMIHDKLAATVTVDIASQMIFNTRKDLIAYKQKVHAEKAAQQTY